MRDTTAPHWRISSYSNDIGQCVEVGFAETTIAVRDTKNRQGGTLTVSPAAWTGFLDRLKTGGYEQD
ncbi:protein of unknown function [Actinopolyspora lacussalsi subsp. righensis]|uniref:DUF397 domain-containing protein n=1 Tax=Actinopolyspora righensis TaxID=995060 RepID=A0A1I7A6B6_9ACTN|nr:DUF397 domain-containing protein [Actinopolyspora righensis]SFT70474.1 protein of unknown function [Actinopolyspora righensis]